MSDFVQLYPFNNKILSQNQGSGLFLISPSSGILSGNWFNNNLPSQSGHIVNKGYLDLTTGQFLVNSTNTGVSLLNSIGLVSGNLTQTGANLQGQINSINNASGQFSTVKITGSNTINNANFTGIGGTLLIYSGEFILVSGAGAGSNVNLSGFGTTGSFDGRYSPIISNLITGAGTFNYISKFVSSSGIGNGNIFDNGNVGINNISPISRLDVTGRITSSGLDINNRVITSNTPVFSATETWNAQVLFTGMRYNVINSGATTGSVFFDITENDQSVFQVNNASGVIIHNGQIGTFGLDTNFGRISIIDGSIVSGSGLSGSVNAYDFRINGTPIAEVYAENDNISGTQNSSFNVKSALGLNPSGLNLASFILGDRPFYVHQGNSAATWVLPPVLITGRTYFLKSRGANVLITGKFGDSIFSTTQVPSFTMSSGEGYILISDGQIWNLM